MTVVPPTSSVASSAPLNIVTPPRAQSSDTPLAGSGPAPVLSLVFPIYNEEAAIPALFERLDVVVADLVQNIGDAEVVFVNDGSRDASMSLLREFASARPWARILNFSRNFGHQVAVTAGMQHTRGQAVVILDADLQDPPELIPEMVRLWREGNDVVYGKRTVREGETAFKKITAAAFYRTLRRLTQVDIPTDTGDFRLIDRRVVDAMNQMGEHHRFLRGMAAWVGFKQVPLPYQRHPRVAGETKYPLHKMLNLAMDAICAFSVAPLKFAMKLGWTIAALSILFGCVTVVRYLLHAGTFSAGWASTIVVISFLSGVQLITLGFVGEYIGRIYDEVKGRPLYLLSEKVGFDETPKS